MWCAGWRYISMVVPPSKSRPPTEKFANRYALAQHGSLGPIVVFPSERVVGERLGFIYHWNTAEKMEVRINYVVDTSPSFLAAPPLGRLG